MKRLVLPRVWLQRLVMAAVPAALIVAAGVSAIWGPHGVLQGERLRQQKAEVDVKLAQLTLMNQGLLREIRLLDRDQVVLERAVADELGWAKPGTKLYRFKD